MARSLASLIYKRVTAFPTAGSTASGSFYQGVVRFSTSAPGDPDTHEDFRPTSKVESSGISLKDIVDQVQALVIRTSAKDTKSDSG